MSASPVRSAVLFPVSHTWDPHAHWYPRALNAQLHPMVSSFLSLGNERIIERFCHLNPSVDKQILTRLISTECVAFKWSGADLFNVTNTRGKRQMIVIETNSCPSGQKSMPVNNTEGEEDGYHTLMKTTFKHILDAADKKQPMMEVAHCMHNNNVVYTLLWLLLTVMLCSHVSQCAVPQGALAVIYDKNDVEASGYAAAMVDVFHEPVYLAEFYYNDTDPPVCWRDGVLHVRDSSSVWHPIRAAFRYVTQKPWQRIPMNSKTMILNPIIACLAGGRNKMIADKAYEFFNHELAASGLAIRTPDTIRDVSKEEIPLWVNSMGGHAVIKIPYSNAGQGVYTITNADELSAFMREQHHYEKFIVQSLVGNASWSSASASSAHSPASTARTSQLFHCGTIPNKHLHTYVSDLRCMVSSTPSGFQPLALYARRALFPLKAHISNKEDSWAMLGTNLSVKKADGTWTTDTSRLLLMDMKDFNKLGLSIDDLIEAYVQTCLSTLAIDKMAQRLMTGEHGRFDRALYKSLNNDESLLNEILL